MYHNWLYSPDWTHISHNRHMIVHMTGLHTWPDCTPDYRYMLGYTSWHQLFVYSCISCLLFAYLFMLLLFSYLLFLVLDLLLFLYTLFICTSISPFLMHSLGCFLTTLNLHVQILDALLYCSGVPWARTLREELKFLPIWF